MKKPIQPPLAKPPDGACPRCGQAFRCGANDPEPCICTSLTLSEGMLTSLRGRYTGCLCLACLQALAGGAALEAVPSRTPGG